MTKRINGGTNGLNERAQLYSFAKNILSNSDSASSSSVLTNMRIGSKGESVKELQKLLGLKVTGVYDFSTKNAVIIWQGSNKLVADGIVGPNTLAALRKAFNV